MAIDHEIMNNPAAIEFESTSHIQGYTLVTFIAGVLFFSVSAAASLYHPVFFALFALPFLPFLLVSKRITLYIFILSFAYAAPLFEYRGELRFDDIIFAIIAITWLMDKALNPVKIDREKKISGLLLIWLCINVLSIVLLLPRAGMAQLLRSTYFFIKMTQYISVYFIVTDLVRDETTRINALRLVWLSTVFICIYGLIEYFIIGETVVTSTLSPNHAHIGVYLLLNIFLFAGYIKYAGNPAEKLLVFCSLPFMVYILFLSTSRASIVALFFGIFVAIMFSRNRLLKIAAAAGIIAGLYMGMDFLTNLENYGLGYASFSSTERDISLLGRLFIWTGIFEYFRANPHMLIQGTGLGALGTFVFPYVPLMRIVSGAHNNFLHFLTETGIGGLLLFLSVMFVLLKRSLAKAREAFRKDRSLYYGYFCALSALLLTCLTQETFSVQPALYNFLGFFFMVTALVLVKT
ncbi:O-antigen ligase family protein [candidate division KSB1 bacterium]